MFDFINKNRYFVFVFLSLISVSILFIVTKNTSKITPIHKVIESTKEQQEEQLKTIGINDFFAQYSRDEDLIHFNWHHNIEQSDIKSIQILYDSRVLVDVTNYSSYQLDREFYHISPGENDFEIVVKTFDDKTFSLNTKVLVNYVVSPEFEIAVDGQFYYITFSYLMSVDRIVDVPNMIVLDDINYERVHIKTIQQESANLVKASTTYRLNLLDDQLEEINVRFFFEEINDSFDYVFQLNKDI